MRSGNTFVTAIFVMAILLTLGLIFLSFGVNTKNIIRRGYVDQLAAYLSEAAAREIILKVRKGMNDPKSEIFRKIVEGGALVDNKVSIPETIQLIRDSNIQKAGGGFSLTPVAIFDGLGGHIYPGGLHGYEKTGNFRVEVIAKFIKKKKKKKESVITWKFTTGLDYRVVNVFSKYGREKRPTRFDSNPTNDYVLWVRAAGLQNALSYGQVMSPKGQQIEIDVAGTKEARVFMGTGAGWEGPNNGNILRTKLLKLDIAPLFINAEKDRLPKPAPAKFPFKLRNARLEFPELFAWEQEDYAKRFAIKLAEEAKKLGKKPADVKQAGQEGEAWGRRHILSLFKSTPLKIAVGYFPIYESIAASNNDDSSTVYKELVQKCITWAGDFLKKKFGKKRKESWLKSREIRKIWEESIKNHYESLQKNRFFGMQNLIQRKIFSNFAFQNYTPIKFKGILDENMEGNFRKRFFQAAFVYWDTSKSKGESYKGETPPIKRWKNQRGEYDCPVPLKSPYIKPPSQGAGDLAGILNRIYKKSYRSGNRQPGKPILTTAFNTDYRIKFEPPNKNKGKMDEGVEGTTLYNSSGQSPGNYRLFQPWQGYLKDGKWQPGDRAKRFISYSFKSQKDFKQSEFYHDGKILLKGLMQVNGDFKFDRETTFMGRGIFMCLGNIVIKKPIKLNDPDEDYCLLFAKGPGRVCDIIVEDGSKIRNISLMALNERYRDDALSTCSTIRTDGKKLDLIGNYVADRVGWASGRSDGRDEAIKKSFSAKIVYDEKLYRRGSGIYAFSMASRYNEWYFSRVP
ncbi:hypothetical protein ACFL35_05585 [Candidatus Riflebacteria bacterium]